MPKNPSPNKRVPSSETLPSENHRKKKDKSSRSEAIMLKGTISGERQEWPLEWVALTFRDETWDEEGWWVMVQLLPFFSFWLAGLLFSLAVVFTGSLFLGWTSAYSDYYSVLSLFREKLLLFDLIVFLCFFQLLLFAQLFSFQTGRDRDGLKMTDRHKEEQTT